MSRPTAAVASALAKTKNGNTVCLDRLTDRVERKHRVFLMERKKTISLSGDSFYCAVGGRRGSKTLIGVGQHRSKIICELANTSKWYNGVVENIISKK